MTALQADARQLIGELADAMNVMSHAWMRGGAVVRAHLGEEIHALDNAVERLRDLADEPAADELPRATTPELPPPVVDGRWNEQLLESLAKQGGLVGQLAEHVLNLQRAQPATSAAAAADDPTAMARTATSFLEGMQTYASRIRAWVTATDALDDGPVSLGWLLRVDRAERELRILVGERGPGPVQVLCASLAGEPLPASAAPAPRARKRSKRPSTRAKRAAR